MAPGGPGAWRWIPPPGCGPRDMVLSRAPTSSRCKRGLPALSRSSRIKAGGFSGDCPMAGFFRFPASGNSTGPFPNLLRAAAWPPDPARELPGILVFPVVPGLAGGSPDDLVDLGGWPRNTVGGLPKTSGSYRPRRPGPHPPAPRARPPRCGRKLIVFFGSQPEDLVSRGLSP